MNHPDLTGSAFLEPHTPWLAIDIDNEIVALRFSHDRLAGILENSDIGTDTWLHCLVGLREIRTQLAGLADDITAYLVPKLGKTTVVDGLGVVHKLRRTNRTKWDRDALLSAVLDSRLVDEDGVVADESPIDKVLAVWLLGAPRVTALRDRHIEASQFCHEEDRGYELKVDTP